jgi:hypothetical protein
MGFSLMNGSLLSPLMALKIYNFEIITIENL